MPEQPRRPWNHNLHYHRLIHEAAPSPCRRALDVGCGEGILAREMAVYSDEVVGIDPDTASVDLARSTTSIPRVSFVLDDVLTHPFEAESFDLIGCVCALHHFDAAAGLRRFDELLAPGGRLVVVGLARRRIPWDLPRDAVGFVAFRWLLIRRGFWHHSAPMVDPPITYPQLETVANDVLPGSKMRHLVLWRYLLTWTKPPAHTVD